MISSPSAIAELIEIPETDTSPVKTIAVLRSAQPGTIIGGRVSNMNAEPMGSVQSSGDSDVKAYCADKLRCLIEGELKSKAEVGQESIAQAPGGQSSSGGAAVIVRSGIQVILGKGARMHWSSTAVKTLIGISDENPVGIGSGESLAKRSAGVAYRSGSQQEETLPQEQSVRRGRNPTLVKTVY